VQTAGFGLQTQAAAPAAPWQVSFAVHVVEFEALTKRQLLPSVEHVETLPPSQNGPAAVHTVGLHLQRPVVPSQVWCVPQAVVVCVKRQLSVSFAQWIDELPEQTSPAAVQFASVTQLQTAAPAVGVVQAWCVPQATAVSAKMHEFPSVLQVDRVELVAQKVVPAAFMHSAGGASQLQAPVGLLPLQLS
jgi:hypothetical protein